MDPRLRVLTATVATCAALVLGGGPAIAGPAAFPGDGPGTTASVPAPPSRAVDVAEEQAARQPESARHVQTDEEEAAEVRTVLALVGALAALTVLVGALAARGGYERC